MSDVSNKFVENEGLEDPSKRDFLRTAGLGTIVLALGGSLLDCAGLQPRTLEETLRDYKSITKKWDPIYGPPLLWFSGYGGKADFKGHQRGGVDKPGVDYVVRKGTPVVPAASCFLYGMYIQKSGGLVVGLDHYPVTHGFYSEYAHLSDKFIDEISIIKLGGKLRLISQNEIFALSGDSGEGPREFGGKQPEHLHFGLFTWDNKTKYLDPEKYGIDGGKPIFSDGETDITKVSAEKRLSELERTLNGFENELETWQSNELQELKGNLKEYFLSLGNYKGTKILGSKHFHDMRALLKRVTLEQKKYIPGTKPYSMMLKIVGYSTDEKQKIILMLPFIAPGLESKYRKIVYEVAPSPPESSPSGSGLGSGGVRKAY